MPACCSTFDEDLDEYPYASTREGGATAHIQPLDSRDNQMQGNDLGRFYSSEGLRMGDDFYVRIVQTRWWDYTG